MLSRSSVQTRLRISCADLVTRRRRPSLLAWAHTPPLTERLERELESHVKSGHVSKLFTFRVCAHSDGPVLRQGHADVKQTHILHVDLCAPFRRFWRGDVYVVVCVLRLPSKPLLFQKIQTLAIPVTVGNALLRIASYQDTWSHWNMTVMMTPSPSRVRKLRTDRGLEFMGRYFQSRGIHQEKLGPSNDERTHAKAERVVRTFGRRFEVDAAAGVVCDTLARVCMVRTCGLHIPIIPRFCSWDGSSSRADGDETEGLASNLWRRWGESVELN
eukprot:1984512-Amphidinium_carterae.2